MKAGPRVRGAEIGYALWTDEAGRNFERDTIQCSHCGSEAFRKPRLASIAASTLPRVGHAAHLGDAALLARKHDEALGGFCMSCMKFVCGECADAGGCTPFEKRLERLDQAERLLRSRGFDPSRFALTPDDFK